MNPINEIPFVNLSRMHDPIRKDIDGAIADIIDHNRYINGRDIADFEQAFAGFVDATHMIGVSSGTDALFLALKALGIKEGDGVVIPDMTFIATAEAVSMTGATPILVDVDPDSAVMDPHRLRECMAGDAGNTIKAVVYVALYGSTVHMNEIAELCQEHDVPLVCDAAQAHGATVNRQGINHLADVITYSFFPGKNLGAFGDAGAVSTMKPDLAERVRILRDHGRSEKYRHDVVGYNCRMDTLQAAILNVKLTQLQAWNENRRMMAEIYNMALAEYPGIYPLNQDAGNSRSVYHLYVIRCQDRQRIVEHLKAHRIGNGIHYPIPVHLQPAYSFLGYAPDEFPVSTRLSKEVLSLPMDGTITEAEVMRVVKAVGEA